MKKTIDKSVNLNLVGINGNAFAILGAFQKQARRDDWTQEEIDKVITEATCKDYDYLLATIDLHCEPIDDTDHEE